MGRELQPGAKEVTVSRVVYFELHAPDPAAAMRFYEQNFGWTFTPSHGQEEYWIITTGPAGERGINGGLKKSHDGQPRTVNTVQVEDIDAAARDIERTGGRVVGPKFPVTGVGWVAYISDPGGNIFGIYAADPNAK
jgi:predicted enzyme related to lactoylglutathione lyase